MRTNIAFDLSIGSITGTADLTNVISGSVSQGVIGALTGSPLQKVQQQLNKAFSDAYVSGAKAGLGVQNRDFKARYTKELIELEKRAKLYQSWQKKIEGEKSLLQKKLLQKQADAVQREIAQRQAGLDRVIRRQTAYQENYFKLLQQYEENAARTFSERTKEAGEGFASAVNQALTLDSLDPSAIVSGISTAFDKAAPALAAAGAKMAGQGGVVGGLGTAATALAGAAGAIAGAAAGIAAVVAVFGLAYGQTKEFNSAIMDGTGALDVMSGSSKSLTANLRDIREAAIGTTSTFRMASTEVVGVLKGLNQAGVTFKEMRQTFRTIGDAQEAYSNVAATTIIQMKVFGQSVDTVAKSIDFMMKDMGYGLESINDAFVTMYAGAKMSGMATADFYTSINEVTSGMARMNFRLEDSVEMLLAMTEILGEDMAKEVTKYSGTFKEMGFTDRMKSVMTSGRGGREVLQGQSKKQGEELAKSIQESGKEMALVSRGLGKMVDGKLQIDTEAMGKMTGTALGALQNELGGALGTRAGALSEMARGAGAGASLGQRASAMGNVDAQGEMAMKMVSAFAVLGEKRIDQMEGLDRAAFEQITGVSGNMFEAYQDISRRVGAQLQEQGKGTGKGGSVTMTDVAKAISEGDLLSDADRAILEEAQVSGMSEMEKLAREQLKETTSISTDIKNKIVSLLESVNGFMEALVRLSDMGGLNEESKAALRKSTAGEQIRVLDELAIQLKGEMENYKKMGGDTKAIGYKQMEEKYSNIGVAQEGLRKSMYGSSGVVSAEAGEALAKVMGISTSAESVKAAGRGEFVTRTGGEVVDTASGGTERIGGVDTVSKSIFGDPEVLEDLAENQGLSLASQLRMQTSSQETAEMTEKTESHTKKLVELMRGETSRRSIAAVSAELGKSEKEIMDMVKAGTLSDTGLEGDEAKLAYKWLMANRKTAGLEDFFYQDGAITPINPNDTLIGMKPKVVGSGSGSGSMGNTINISINGGNPAEVYRVVKSALGARGL